MNPTVVRTLQNRLADGGLDTHTDRVAELVDELVVVRTQRQLSETTIRSRMGGNSTSVDRVELRREARKFATILRYAHAVGARVHVTVTTRDGAEAPETVTRVDESTHLSQIQAALVAIREEQGLDHVHIAKALGWTAKDIRRTEERDDLLMSTLCRHAVVLGADLTFSVHVAARTYMQNLGQWSRTNSEQAQLASEGVYGQANAAETAKNSMPEPVETHGLMGDFGTAMKSNPVNPIGAFQEAMEKREQADAAHQEAARVMTTYDKNLYEVASKQPAFSPPPEFAGGNGGDGGGFPGTGVVNIPGDANTTSASGYGGGPAGGAPVVPGGGGPGNVSGPAGGNPGVMPTPTPMPGNSTGQGQVGTGPGGANAPAARMPTGTPGAGAGFGGMGPVGPVAGGGAAGGNTPYNSKLGRPAAAGGFGPTGSGSGSAAGAAKGAAGAAGGAPGAGSGSGAAKPGMGGAGAGPGAAAAAGGGARGAGGAGMMGGAGARPNQQGGDEEEHQRPSWLVEADPDSLFGTDQRTAPPVIGE
ncbi:hypothetical protein [Saccharomonospora sp. CUA-673]|uniref:hypothetical protein n=1 Tax=Saccharomonospora sp. CUA-673 TaxID=1904969 RepID=UPI000A9305F8|nr:hypothetical protein [Saccharomonospora sp. CUA-673]